MTKFFYSQIHQKYFKLDEVKIMYKNRTQEQINEEIESYQELCKHENEILDELSNIRRSNKHD